MPAQIASFELRVSPASHAITRMLSCCIARGFEIVEMRWQSGGPEAKASLALAGEPARLARAGLWLDRLVDVLEVCEMRNDPHCRGPFLREE